MSCTHHAIKFRSPADNTKLSHQPYLITNSVMVPVFCVCMISAMGSASGMRHTVFMQFDVDADTEYIKTANAGYQQMRYLNIEESF